MEHCTAGDGRWRRRATLRAPAGEGKVGTGRVRVMSSYAKYCRDQAAECARRVRLANSPEVVANCRNLGLRWLKLAAKAEATDRACMRANRPRLRALAPNDDDRTGDGIPRP